MNCYLVVSYIMDGYVVVSYIMDGHVVEVVINEGKKSRHLLKVPQSGDLHRP